MKCEFTIRFNENHFTTDLDSEEEALSLRKSMLRCFKNNDDFTLENQDGSFTFFKYNITSIEIKKID